MAATTSPQEQAAKAKIIVIGPYGTMLEYFSTTPEKTDAEREKAYKNHLLLLDMTRTGTPGIMVPAHLKAEHAWFQERFNLPALEKGTASAQLLFKVSPEERDEVRRSLVPIRELLLREYDLPEVRLSEPLPEKHSAGRPRLGEPLRVKIYGPKRPVGAPPGPRTNSPQVKKKKQPNPRTKINRNGLERAIDGSDAVVVRRERDIQPRPPQLPVRGEVGHAEGPITSAAPHPVALGVEPYQPMPAPSNNPAPRGDVGMIDPRPYIDMYIALGMGEEFARELELYENQFLPGQ